ncbi:hypothetical protein ABK040_011058 [Willaertia magna]
MSLRTFAKKTNSLQKLTFLSTGNNHKACRSIFLTQSTKKFFICCNNNQQQYFRNFSTNLSSLSEENNNTSSSLNNKEEQNQQQFNVKELKKQLLEVAIEKYVPINGWTINSLISAAKDINLSSMAIPQLFNSTNLGPETELIQYFITKCNRTMSERIQLMDKTNMSPALIIKEAIRIRLELIAPFVKLDKWSEAMSTFILGNNNPLTNNAYQMMNVLSGSITNTNPLTSLHQVNGLNALYHLSILADEICYIAGLRDTDIQWYLKRAAVALVYSSSEFYMLTDKSEGFKDTFEFLDRRMSELSFLHETQENVLNTVQGLVGGVFSFLNTQTNNNNTTATNHTGNVGQQQQGNDGTTKQ